METITVTLDKARAIKWTNRSIARLGSLERPPVVRDLVHKNASRAYYALLSFLWAALEDRTAFAEPEALADHLQSAQSQDAAWEALHIALVEGGVLEGEKKRTAPELIGSPNGPSASSSSGPAAPTTTT